jgi:hypothetical protein
MTLRPALAGAAIIALLLTGCANPPERETRPRAASSSTPAATPTPSVVHDTTLTTEPAAAPAAESAGESAGEETPETAAADRH